MNRDRLHSDDIPEILDLTVIKEKLPQIETTHDVTAMILHEISQRPIHDIEMQIHHQIDPSYQ
jgi:hypothetical protein